MIQFTIEDRTGERQALEIPEGIGLNLMEVLKASEYNILATCGGMALCATCHVEILDGGETLSPINDAELDILDTLPSATSCSRLACQLRVDEAMAGTVFKIRGEEH
jgi:ferredoxin